MWSVDLYTRKPGPAVTEDGDFVGTDLDLACFMQALVDRQAVVNLPTYTGRRASQKREGERIISKENRHGTLTGLTANREVFSFGVRLIDHNVVQRDPTTGKETVGAPRNFMLVDVDGEWYDGWRCIEFSPSAKENSFLNDKKLWTDNKVVFKNFVHPNRWISFYGSYYFMTKVLIERLEEEAKFLKSEVDRLLKAGFTFPSGEGPKEWPHSEKVGAEKKIKVNAFEVEVDIPEFSGQYPPYPNSQAGLILASDRRKALVYGVTPRLRFATRSVELAFHKYGFMSTTGVMENPTAADRDASQTGTIVEKMPAWIKDAAWERDYVLKGKRSKWNRLVLFQPAPGQQGVALRYRTWEKTETVAAD